MKTCKKFQEMLICRYDCDELRRHLACCRECAGFAKIHQILLNTPIETPATPNLADVISRFHKAELTERMRKRLHMKITGGIAAMCAAAIGIWIAFAGMRTPFDRDSNVSVGEPVPELIAALQDNLQEFEDMEYNLARLAAVMNWENTTQNKPYMEE